MGRDLTNLYIDQSFQNLLQISGSQVNDGTGSLVTLLDVTSSNATSASYAVTASYALNVPAFDTGSLLVTASISDATITFVKGDTSTFDLTVDNVANALNSSHSANTVVTVKNLEATTIAKGTPLYITGSGTSGNLVGVYRADASNPLRMPAGCIAGESLAPGAEGLGYLDGYITGVSTTGFSEGQPVYVGVGGGYQATRPTGSANLVQALGYISKVHPTNGSGVIQGSGRANDVPNIQRGYVWVGGVGDVATTVSTGSLSVFHAVSASYAVSASHEIIKEISSSYADYAKEAGYATSSLSSSYAVTASHALNAGTWDGQYTGDAGITGSLTVIGATENALRVGTTGSADYVTIAGPTSVPYTFDGNYIQGIGSFRDNNDFQYLTHPVGGGNTTLYASGSFFSKVATNVNGGEVLKVVNQPGGERGLQVTGNTINLQMTDSGSYGLFIDYYGSATSRAQTLLSVGGYNSGTGWVTTSNLIFGQADQSFFSAEGDFFIKNINPGTGSVYVWSENNLALQGDTTVEIQGDYFSNPNQSIPIYIRGTAFAYTMQSNINGFSSQVNEYSLVADYTRAFVETPLKIALGGTVVVGTGSTLKVINEL